VSAMHKVHITVRPEALTHTWRCYEMPVMEQEAEHPTGSVVQL